MAQVPLASLASYLQEMRLSATESFSIPFMSDSVCTACTSTRGRNGMLLSTRSSIALSTGLKKLGHPAAHPKLNELIARQLKSMASAQNLIACAVTCPTVKFGIAGVHWRATACTLVCTPALFLLNSIKDQTDTSMTDRCKHALHTVELPCTGEGIIEMGKSIRQTP